MLAHEFDVDKAVYETFKIAETKQEGPDKFGNHAPIYLAPTGNTKDAVGLYSHGSHNIESALVVGSQGSFAHELALNGVKKIDCFDKNILQYLFYALFETAIRNIDFCEFLSNFTSKRTSSFEQRFDHILSDWLFFDVLDQMGNQEAEYWAKIFKSGQKDQLIASNLFRTYYPFLAENLRHFSSVYNIGSYEELQYLLNTHKVDITYHICDLDEIHKEFAGEKYGLIMLGNILQYYKQIPALDNVGAVNRFLKDKWSNMLTEDGKIQLCYGFEVVGDAVSNLMHLGGIQKINNISDLSIKYAREKDQKEGYICNVIKKYGVGDDSPYSIDFIRAVEEMDGHKDAKNVILTYKPR